MSGPHYIVHIHVCVHKRNSKSTNQSAMNMDVIKMYPVKESNAYGRALEDRLHQLGEALEHNQVGRGRSSRRIGYRANRESG